MSLAYLKLINLDIDPFAEYNYKMGYTDVPPPPISTKDFEHTYTPDHNNDVYIPIEEDDSDQELEHNDDHVIVNPFNHAIEGSDFLKAFKMNIQNAMHPSFNLKGLKKEKKDLMVMLIWVRDGNWDEIYYI